MGDGRSDASTADTPTDDVVVEAAADAATDLVLSRLDREELDDLDVTISFEEGVLEVDVYLHAPAASVDEAQLADDAALAARAAVDDLFEETAPDRGGA
ncbi:MAG: DUF3194 domain-containing protein [Halobacteriaceae archaeon]